MKDYQCPKVIFLNYGLKANHLNVTEKQYFAFFGVPLDQGNSCHFTQHHLQIYKQLNNYYSEIFSFLMIYYLYFTLSSICCKINHVYF